MSRNQVLIACSIAILAVSTGAGLTSRAIGAIYVITTCATTTPCTGGTNTSTGAGVGGTNTTTGIGVQGTNTSSAYTATGFGMSGSSTNGSGVRGTTTHASTGPANATYGVVGIDNSTTGLYDIGVKGLSNRGLGTSGQSTSNIGTRGISSSSYGVYGTSTSGVGTAGFSGSNLGVYGTSSSSYGTYGASTASIGALGISSQYIGTYGSGPNTGTYSFSGAGIGARGISSSGTGVYAQSSTGFALQAHTNSGLGAYVTTGSGNGADITGTYIGIVARATSFPIVATDPSGNNLFYVDGAGNVFYHGALSKFMPVAKGASVTTFSAQSATPAMEDTGTARLTAGVATVGLDPAFAAAIDANRAYHVFLTPGGDTRGLYVARKTSTYFVVREVQGGRGTFDFDYHIYATEIGKANQRMTLTGPNAKALQRRTLPAVEVRKPK